MQDDVQIQDNIVVQILTQVKELHKKKKLNKNKKKVKGLWNTVANIKYFTKSTSQNLNLHLKLDPVVTELFK